MTSKSLVPVRPNAPAPFGEELCVQIVELLSQKFGANFHADAVLTVSGEVAHAHALVRCQLEKQDQTSKLSFEICVETEANKIENPLEARDLAVDHVEVILTEFFENDRLIHLSPIWKPHDVESKTLLIKGEQSNPHLEDEANRLLAAAGFDPVGNPLDS